MKILVTGGAGFIGSHVVDLLLRCGHEVHVLDDLSSGKKCNLPAEVPLYCKDIRDPEASSLMETERYDALVHHAAQMNVRRSVDDPVHDSSVNIGGFLNLMEAGRKSGLQRVIFASTGGAIYGEPEHVPQTEQHVLRPVSPYGIAKLATENYLHYYALQYGIHYVALRYGNVYGPRQNPHGEAGVVAIFCERLLKGQGAVIYGDGLQTRDYVYVKDVAEANASALEYSGPSIALNIGAGTETNVIRLFQLIRSALGKRATYSHAPAKKGEQRRSVLAFSQAASELDWRPTVSLEEGIWDTVQWFAARH